MFPIGFYRKVPYRRWHYLKGLEGLGCMALLEEACH